MDLLRRGPDAVSPTAHYTGHVWARNGLGAPGLTTPEGFLAFHALRPAMALSRLAGGPTLEQLLLARHVAMDAILEAAIQAGEVGTIVELAAGMSPRGATFATRHGAALTYVETDLPAMAARKRRALRGRLGPDHRVAPLDALEPGALEALLGELDPLRGVAVVGEGLLNYLPRAGVEGLWGRTARALRRFPAGLHLADLHLRADNGGLLEGAFIAGLGAAVGGVHLHFADAAGAEAALARAGFATGELVRPADVPGAGPDASRPGGRRVRLVVARR